jgi:hypothetical protein
MSLCSFTTFFWTTHKIKSRDGTIILLTMRMRVTCQVWKHENQEAGYLRSGLAATSSHLRGKKFFTKPLLSGSPIICKQMQSLFDELYEIVDPMLASLKMSS